MVNTMEWRDASLLVLNQTLLPHTVEYIECDDYRRVAEAIRRLEVRGAPAIGVAAAYGFLLGVRELARGADFLNKVAGMAEALKATRPTAVNLFWAIDRMLAVVEKYRNVTLDDLLIAVEKEAHAIAADDVAINNRLAVYGASLFTIPTAVLTHCNAGALATAGVGTALGVIRQAWVQGNITQVFADETRPLLQGGRLTAWELAQDKIPVTVITDNMAGWVMKKQMVQAVIVGADRIALNGDVANKIGTYSVAVLAKEHKIPFYVAAPISTFDFSMETGEQIPIEERSAAEITHFSGRPVTPDGVAVFNPAFDVTPNSLIAGIITEYGILKAPYEDAIKNIKQLIERV